MLKEYVLVLGADQVKSHDEQGVTLGPMTQCRVKKTAEYAEIHTVHICVAAGVWPEYPNSPSMAQLMLQALDERGVTATLIGPDTNYNTKGELQVFMDFVPEDAHKTLVSAWWHLPRIRRLIAMRWGKSLAKSCTYVSSDESLTLRLFYLECIKWLLTYFPEKLQGNCVQGYRKIFGRSSW